MAPSGWNVWGKLENCVNLGHFVSQMGSMAAKPPKFWK